MRTLLLPLLIAGALRAQTTDPTAQLVNQLNTASLQLQALGTLTLNNNTFVQLVQVLNTVFGNMRASMMPFYYSQMKSIDSYNLGIATRIAQMNGNIDAVYSVLVSYVQSMSSSYTGQLAGISSMLNDFQTSSIARLDAMKVTMDQYSSQILALQTQMNSISSATTSLVAQADSALTQIPVLTSGLQTVLNPTKKVVQNIELGSAVLGDTSVPYCKALVYVFPAVYSAIPKASVDINLINASATPTSNPPKGYDVSIGSVSVREVTVWICDLSRNTFNLLPANVLITTWL